MFQKHCKEDHRMATKGKASHKSISKVENIHCRVETCQEEIKTQNYERHLEIYHPNENKKDKRPYGQGNKLLLEADRKSGKQG